MIKFEGELTEEEKTHGKWSIFYKKVDWNGTDEIVDGDFHSYLSPENMFFADPIPVKHEDKYYVFFEEFDYKQGRIAYFVIDEDMKASERKYVKFIEPTNIKPICDNHASYPYVFQVGGTYYMIPETSHWGQIRLYRCVDFPGTWEYVKNILENVHAGDSSVIQKDGAFFMFTTIYSNRFNYFAVYYADDILGEWTEHPVNEHYRKNDSLGHLSRGAGITIPGKAITRPAQFSSRGTNGEAVILYEIYRLTKEEFVEMPVKIISKENFKGIRAIHIFSLCEDLLIIDARQERTSDYEYKKINSFNLLPEIDATHDEEMEINHDLIKEAFSCNTSGNGLCYYSATINGVHYPGERNWDARWDLLKYTAEIDFTDKKILDIGCNMGIMLTYLKYFKNAGKCTGIEEPDEMLAASNKKDTVKAAKLLAEGFNVDIEIK